MDTEMIAVYIVTFAAAIGLWFFIRWAARTFGSSGLPEAAAAFAELADFTADDIHIYLGSAIAHDATRNRIAIWEKKSGARLVSRAEVGAWHSGTLLTVVLDRTTATPMVQLYSQADDQTPFFKVGVVEGNDCERWTAHLSAAFGAERDREIAVRVLGVN